ncbi:hypothetical protein IWQ57_006207, partial [Coemansia nantahalensis]
LRPLRHIRVRVLGAAEPPQPAAHLLDPDPGRGAVAAHICVVGPGAGERKDGRLLRVPARAAARRRRARLWPLRRAVPPRLRVRQGVDRRVAARRPAGPVAAAGQWAWLRPAPRLARRRAAAAARRIPAHAAQLDL